MSLPSIAFDYATAPKPLGYRANMGAIVLQTDETLEQDMRRLIPLEGVALYVSRIAFPQIVTNETLGGMKALMTASAQLLPPQVRYDSVGYGCTSATCVIGHDAVAEQVEAGCQAANVVTPLSGLLDACQALDVKRLAIVSPYVPEVNDSLRTAITNGGVEVVAEACFFEGDDAKVAQLDPTVVEKAAVAVDAMADCDAVFISCTNVRTLEIIPQLRQRLNKPVLSSNLCLIWRMMQLAGLSNNLLEGEF